MNAICDNCDDSEGWIIDGPEGIASVYWVDEHDEEVDVSPRDDPADHPELTKRVFRECPECGHTWEYDVE